MSLDIWLKQTENCPTCGHGAGEVFSANITHNLRAMWAAAGVEDALHESAGKCAMDIVVALRAGLADMRARPDFFRTFDAPNKWGTYEDAVPWLANLVAACEQYPKAVVSISR